MAEGPDYAAVARKMAGAAMQAARQASWHTDYPVPNDMQGEQELEVLMYRLREDMPGIKLEMLTPHVLRLSWEE